MQETIPQHPAPSKSDFRTLQTPPSNVRNHVPVQQSNDFHYGQWEAGLFACHKHLVPNCLLSVFFPVVPLARISAHIGWMSYQKALCWLVPVYFCGLAFAGATVYCYMMYKSVGVYEFRQLSLGVFIYLTPFTVGYLPNSVSICVGGFFTLLFMWILGPHYFYQEMHESKDASPEEVLYFYLVFACFWMANLIMVGMALFTCILRQHVRRHFRIREHYSDCFTLCCFFWWTITQMATQVKLHESKSSHSQSAPDVLEANSP